ncbi:SAM-dependent methyltransferase [Micromonospora sp. NPDC050417]|uniref:SAM-dependent methyltransferase n=1 Tax=Micromonospora sp. NPDC050417 TaxID=3364280 RepID=UPI0037AF1652
MSITIAGAGVAGLAAALSLHAAGRDDITVYEADPAVDQHGFGLNILPNAVRELAELGLLDSLLRHAVETRELAMYNPYGDLVWREDRGVWAGYRWPQISVARSHLLRVLAAEVRNRLGDQAVVTGARLTDLRREPGRTYAVFTGADGTSRAVETDVLIGADGIRSAVRAALYPGEGPPSGNGTVMYRGTAWGEGFLTGSSMAVLGDDRRRLVLYPIDTDETTGRKLINWVAAVPAEEAGEESRAVVLRRFGDWRPPGVDLARLVGQTPEVYTSPMIDRDPLPQWTFGTVTLAGDAAHAMYPAGSNGATQAIIDARVLAWHLATHPGAGDALRAYADERRPRMTRLQADNRTLGPERAITLAHQRAPRGFTDVREIFGPEELADISRGYAAAGQFDREWVDSRPSLTVGGGRRSTAVRETSFITAVIRGRECNRPDAYLRDNHAVLLSTPRSCAMADEALAAGGTIGSVIVRGRFGDVALTEAVAAGVSQVVCLAAGSDTRVWRLGLRATTRYFEIDLPGHLEAKEKLLEPVAGRLACRRVPLDADLRHGAWPHLLRAAGHASHEPTVWIIEGLLPYLPTEDVAGLLATVREMSAPGSVLLIDAPHGDFYRDPANEAFLAFMTARGSAFQLGFDDFGGFLGEQGWRAEAYTLRDLASGACDWLPTPPQRLCPPHDHHWVARAHPA